MTVASASLRLAVVVPARDEQRLIGRCLQSIGAADRRLQAVAGRSAHVVVVLDRCVDDTAAVADTFGVDAVPSDAGSAGAARAAGVTAALRSESAQWVAMTDADCVVPDDWLVTHHRLARRGLGLAVGSVRPDPDELSTEAWHTWRRRHLGRVSVHGANLGFSPEAYQLAGGFAAATEHEDVDFVRRAREAGVSWTLSLPTVTTSARTDGRTPGGFAGYLRRLLSENPTDSLPRATTGYGPVSGD